MRIATVESYQTSPVNTPYDSTDKKVTVLSGRKSSATCSASMKQPQQKPSNFKTFMPLNFVGKKLYPRLPAWERRRRIKTIFIVAVISIIVGIILGWVMFLRNAPKGVMGSDMPKVIIAR